MEHYKINLSYHTEGNTQISLLPNNHGCASSPTSP